MKNNGRFLVWFLSATLIVLGLLTLNGQNEAKILVQNEVKILEGKLSVLANIEKQILPDGRYDNNDLQADPDDDFSTVQKSLVYLVTKAKFESFMEGGEPIEKVWVGSGFVASFPKGKGFPKGKYIFTLDHVVSQYKLAQQMRTPYGIVMLENDKRISEKTYLLHEGQEVEIEELINSFDTDIALFKLPDDIDIPEFPYEFGNSDELEIGNTVYVLGRPSTFAEIIPRKGIVSSKKGFYRSEILTEKYGISKMNFYNGGSYIPEHMFSMTAGLNPGDSGLPIVALRDGKYELVGLAQGTAGKQKLGVVLRINFILDEIKRHLK